MSLLKHPVIGLRDEYPAGFVDPMHSHDRVQILYASAGVMSVRTPETSFVIPPQRALWLPAGAPHEVACRGPVSLRTLYLPAQQAALRDECRAFEVSDLLRCLILEAVEFAPRYDRGGREDRIMALMLEEIDRMPDAPCRVTLPSDARLVRVCQAILSDPSDPRDINDWAKLAAMTRRTLTRSFKKETGASLAAWRRQVRLMEALSLLGAGASITQASFAVGYESPGAFTAMFRRALGVAPARYLSR